MVITGYFETGLTANEVSYSAGSGGNPIPNILSQTGDSPTAVLQELRL
jgi:hypothetical protein